MNMKQFGTDLHAGVAELHDGVRKLLVEMREDVRDAVGRIRVGMARSRHKDGR